MAGIIYTTNGSIAAVSNPGVLTAQQQSVPCNGLTYNLSNSLTAVNGHLGNRVQTPILRPAGKIYLQTTNNTPILLNSLNNTYITTNQLMGNQFIINGNLVTRSNSNIITVTHPEAPRPSTSNTAQQISYQSLPKIQTAVKLEPSPIVVQQEVKTEPQIKVKEEPEIIEIPPTPPVEEEQAEIDIMINNVVCSFSVGCHLDLRNIALQGKNVEFRRENGMVTMKLRNPPATASIWSSGKITCTGSTAEDQARLAARRVARCMQRLGYNVRFRNYRIVNVLGTCAMPFGILIAEFSTKHRKSASYEPELHPGVTYKIADPKATLKVFSTGSITVTAPSVANVQHAIEHIYPLVKEFSKIRKVCDIKDQSRLIPGTNSDFGSGDIDVE